MCGIAGYCGNGLPAWLEQSCTDLRHRGPDDGGVYVDPKGRIGLAHCRLAILDLSSAGHQPMSYGDGRYQISYNGELYNFRELRTELEALGYRFKSHTDTEVILAAWQEWGRQCLNKFNGIFAFGLWDATEHQLFLIRDPLGVKPLYWATASDRSVYFSSETGPLMKVPGITRECSPEALDAYLAFLWIPAPRTLYRDIQQLLPGHLLVCAPGKLPKIEMYTDLYAQILREPIHKRTPGELWEILKTCVNRQRISDVPIGVFLSGGLDSTGILAACEHQRDQLTAYTIAFNRIDSNFEAASNDLAYAKEAAVRYGVRHEILEVDANITTRLPEYLAHMDQPVGDHAPLASYLICQAAAARNTKVLLSGQGADEIFAGYPWHRAGVLASQYNHLPGILRQYLIEPVARRLPGGKGGKWLGNLRRLKRFLSSASLPWPERYVALCRYLDPNRRKEFQVQLQGDMAEKTYLDALRESADLSLLGQMLYTDLKTFLPDLNLFYTDRTGMAHGVEVRVPYLDLDMVRFAFSISDDQKIGLGSNKVLLKEAMKPHLPAGIINRRKAGFGLPVRSWMQSTLRPLIQEHLSSTRIRKRGLWNSQAVERLINEQQSGREDRAYLLFALLALELWMVHHLDNSR